VTQELHEPETPRDAAGNPGSLLDVRDLRVEFHTSGGGVQAVRNVSFAMKPGEIVALVGESGSGKSTIGLAIMRLIERESRVQISGRVAFRGKSGRQIDLLKIPENQMRHVRGDEIAMIFQEPMSSLNPIFTIGGQIVEAIKTHQGVSRREARSHALEMLQLLGIPNPEKCLTSYPHQISGGMRQRVMIAMGLSCNPNLLIADEPTTALDVTIQAQIIEHLKKLQEQTGMSILFITHDLGLVAEIADRVLVLYAGQVVELGAVASLFGNPLMPYTRALLASIPQLGQASRAGYHLDAIPGSVPSPLAFPQGCAFHPRCAYFQPSRCDAAGPPLENRTADHAVRCFRWREIQGERRS
jgi:oligopeptide transport system ATP-binding protein